HPTHRDPAMPVLVPADSRRRLPAAAACLLPVVVCAATGWALWRVFDGGLIGADGRWQVDQARARRINDWLPPAMTAVLRLGLSRSDGVAPVILIQAVLGCLGVFHLVRAALRFLYPGLLPAGREVAAALGILFVLLVPLSPLPYYLVYVQSD